MDRKFDCTFVGDINPDLVMTSAGQLPELGKEVEYKNFYSVLGGSTGICAGVFGSLGMGATFYGHVGDDLFGRFSVEALAATGVDVSNIVTERGGKTPVTISVTTPKDRALMSYLGRLDGLCEDDLTDQLIEGTRHIHIGSFFFQQELQPGFLRLFKRAHEKGVTTSLDAGWDTTENWDYGIRELLGFTDIFFPNDTEAQAITRRNNPVEAALELSRYCGTVVVKCGKEGSVLRSGEKLLRCPTYSRYKAIDSTGAGDSYNAGFLHAFLSGMPWLTCMKYGSAVASLRVSVDRSVRPWSTLAEVEDIVSNENE